MHLKSRPIDVRVRRPIMAHENCTLSFDIFDTTLTRIWFKPTDLFLAVGRELTMTGLYSGSAESWAIEREKAEHDVRQTVASTSSPASEEISLYAVYDLLAARLALSPLIRGSALKIELELERTASRPIALSKAAILEAIAVGKSVIFLSDTYFEQDFIIDLLRKAGIDPGPNGLYTSLALGYTKRTGSLFEHVLSERGLTPSELSHVGDNPQSDVASARRIGICADQFKVQRPNRYERALYANTPNVPRVLASAVAGAARATRLLHKEIDSHQQIVADTAADVAAPILTGFVLWVLLEANRRGLKRLYFLARDGQILQRIALRLATWLGWGLELRYLYASRQSLFLPSITSFDDVARDWLLDNAGEMTLRTILSRLELDPNAEIAMLDAAGFQPEAWDVPLGEAGQASLRALTKQPEFIEHTLAQAQVHRELLLDYLVQEGFMNESHVGVVDIGWQGRLQRCLAQTLATFTGSKSVSLTGFYFGLARRPDSAVAGELVAYDDVPHPNTALLETFVKADHGSVRRFRRIRDGSMKPELAETRDREASEWGLGAQQRTIIDFVDLMLSVLKPAYCNPEEIVDYLRDRGRAVFNLFCHFPTHAEAAAYGSLCHAPDQTHANPAEIAPSVARFRLLSLFLRRHSKLNRHIPWAQGSIARSIISSKLERRLLLALWEARRSAAANLRAALRH
jgi:predicted HAD superfamily hydrolase